jgi:hypothetical protein
MLLVGYDDNLQCWIARNSWGTAYGNDGYFLIAYGECNIDYYSKQGLTDVSPDPWSRRRLHNGCLIQSSDGPEHRNFELLRAGVPRVQHLWRDGGGAFAWHLAETLTDLNDASAGAGCIGMPALTSTTYNRNFETVYWEKPNRLRYWYFDQTAQKWVDVGYVGDATAIVADYPAFIQSNFDSPEPGDLEVVFRGPDGTLQHWTGSVGANIDWTRNPPFAGNIQQSGPALVQGLVGTSGHFYVVAVLNTGEMQLFWRNNDIPGNKTWTAGEIFGSGIASSPPCMIQGNYGTANELQPGNFELCVAHNGQIQHWWRKNSNLDTQPPVVGHVTPPATSLWIQSATFGTNIKHVWALIESSYGYDLEVIAELNSGQLQHFWRDRAGWHNGPVINV